MWTHVAHARDADLRTCLRLADDNHPNILVARAKLMAALASAGVEAKRKSGSTEIIPAGSIGKLAASVVARQASHVPHPRGRSDPLRASAESSVHTGAARDRRAEGTATTSRLIAADTRATWI